MALTVKQLNADASFLLTFEPIAVPPGSGQPPEPFTILLDPWITGPSTILHSKFSVVSRKEPACISSLEELPEPNLVIISHHKSDHCNEATLRQLPAAGTKTLILAEPAAAKVIRGWKYFDSDKVRTLQRWEDPRITGKQTVVRVKVPSPAAGSEPGDVTVAFISQKKRDLKSSHAAVGITYRPPPVRKPHARSLLTPPGTPKSQVSGSRVPTPPSLTVNTNALLLASPTPPASPNFRSLRSVRSTASLSPHAIDRAVSVIFSPHGMPYRCIEPFATSHLVNEAALPLTALLHCFDAVSNPWWFGGDISAGVPAGQETAAALGAKVWVSTHDGDKDVKGLVSRMSRRRKYAKEEVVEVVSPRSAECDQNEKRVGVQNAKRRGPEVLALGAGEEVVLTSEGLWGPDSEEASALFESRDVEGMPSMEQVLS